MNENEIISESGNFIDEEENTQDTEGLEQNGTDSKGSDEFESEPNRSGGSDDEFTESEGSEQLEESEETQTIDYTEYFESLQANTEQIAITDSIENLNIESVVLIVILIFFGFTMILGRE